MPRLLGSINKTVQNLFIESIGSMIFSVRQTDNKPNSDKYPTLGKRNSVSMKHARAYCNVINQMSRAVSPPKRTHDRCVPFADHMFNFLKYFYISISDHFNIPKR